MNRTQEGTETGRDGVQGARGHQRPSASCLPLLALRRWCFNARSLQRLTTLWEVTELCSERSLAQCQPTNASVQVRPPDPLLVRATVLVTSTFFPSWGACCLTCSNQAPVCSPLSAFGLTSASIYREWQSFYFFYGKLLVLTSLISPV